MTKVQKLREICGNSVMSKDYDKMIKIMAAKEQRPRPHKRQLSDGYTTAMSY